MSSVDDDDDCQLSSHLTLDRLLHSSAQPAVSQSVRLGIRVTDVYIDVYRCNRHAVSLCPTTWPSPPTSWCQTDSWLCGPCTEPV